MEKLYDVTAMGEMLIDFTQNGQSGQGNQLFEACPGGAPCNVLAMLSKLGRKTAFIGKVGDDQFGRLLKRTIEDLGVESRGLILDQDIHTTLAFVHTLSDGDREFSFYRKPGADMMLMKEEVDYDLIRQSKIFHFGTLSMTDEPARTATEKALETAREEGCLITFDPNLRPPLWSSMEDAKKQMEFGFGYCDILKISDNEIQFVSGMEDYDDGIRYLQKKYQIPLIFLTMGKEGSRAYYRNLRVERPGFSVKSVETTGAGDTFFGCAIHGVLEYGLDKLNEQKLGQILTYANGGAALITTKKGAICSMPETEDIMKLLGEQ
ncbi:MAG: carbohydrate kinase [Lachnospiraceae bacterium]|jgi:hypothetical protein|nr:carbohydrate kinase [Lachnospiraceae bacterium]